MRRRRKEVQKYNNKKCSNRYQMWTPIVLAEHCLDSMMSTVENECYYYYQNRDFWPLLAHASLLPCTIRLRSIQCFDIDISHVCRLAFDRKYTVAGCSRCGGKVRKEAETLLDVQRILFTELHAKVALQLILGDRCSTLKA